MRVHQPGSHLMRGGRPQVDDWSWAQTKHRLATLYRLARPYKPQTLLAIVSLLGATVVGLAPPYLVGRTIDHVRHGSTSDLGVLVALFVIAGVLATAFTFGQTYFTGWTGERMLADLRNHLFRHLQRLSARLLRAEPRRRHHQPSDERRRGSRPARHGRCDVTRPEHADPCALRRRPVLPRLATRARDADDRAAGVRVATAWFRKRSGRAYRGVRETLGAVTATLAEDIAGMRVLQSFTRERAASANFTAVADRYREANMQTVVLNGVYFPAVDFLSSAATAVVLGYGGWLAFNGDVSIGTLVAFLGYLSNFFDPVQQLSQLYNTFLSAVAALDKITDLMDEEPEVVDLPGAVTLDSARGRRRVRVGALRLRPRA